MRGQHLGGPFGEIAGMVPAVVSDDHTALPGAQSVDDSGNSLGGVRDGIIVHHPGTRAHL